jgi:hypothetical protein
VPISADKLDAAIGSWESFIHAEFPDRLVQLAIVHAEFESLHPFLDGNGRIGRMVLPLFLWQAGILRMPYFYLSAYFEALHPRRRAFDAIGIPVPERGAEVGVRWLLGPGDWVKQVAGQVGGAVLPQSDAGEAAAGGLEVGRQ